MGRHGPEHGRLAGDETDALLVLPVYAAVLFQVGPLTKQFATHMTFKWFLSSVDPIVVSKVRTLKKATSTETTFVWFLSSVNHLVLSEAKAIAKYFPTQRTFTQLAPTVNVTLCIKG